MSASHDPPTAPSRDRLARDYHRVARAIRFIQDHALEQPGLDRVAAHLGLSEHHVQRLFTRWAGVSPKRFLQYLTLERAKEILEEGRAVLEASWDAGLSGPGRLHDHFVTLEGVTPGEFKEGGRGVEIRWGVHPTPFGNALFAATDRGLTALSFLESERDEDHQGDEAAGSEDAPDREAVAGNRGLDRALDRLEAAWPRARIQEDRGAVSSLAERIFGGEGGSSGDPRPRDSPGEAADDAPAATLEASDRLPHGIRLHVRGTNFQIRVWEALLRVPPGGAVTYGDLARAVGRPEAARAVGGAVGANPVAWVIPCHRVLRSTGHFGGYRWGGERKRAILGWEASRRG